MGVAGRCCRLSECWWSRATRRAQPAGAERKRTATVSRQVDSASQARQTQGAGEFKDLASMLGMNQGPQLHEEKRGERTKGQEKGVMTRERLVRGQVADGKEVYTQDRRPEFNSFIIITNHLLDLNY